MYIPHRAASPEADPRQVTLARLDRFVSTSWVDAPLEAVLRDIAELSGVDMVVMWVDEDNPTLGLRPERKVTLRMQHIALLDVIEKILERADTRADGRGSTWQLTNTGTLQIGPRERLDKWLRLETYDVTNLMLVIKDFWHLFVRADSTFAEFRLTDMEKTRARGEELRQVIVDTCEPRAWSDHGGVGTIRFHVLTRAFVVNAPDYAHRAAFGYEFFRRSRSIESTPTTRPTPKPAKEAPPKQSSPSRNN